MNPESVLSQIYSLPPLSSNISSFPEAEKHNLILINNKIFDAHALLSTAQMWMWKGHPVAYNGDGKKIIYQTWLIKHKIIHFVMRFRKTREQYDKKHKEQEPRKLVHCLVLLP